MQRRNRNLETVNSNKIKLETLQERKENMMESRRSKLKELYRMENEKMQYEIYIRKHNQKSNKPNFQQERLTDRHNYENLINTNKTEFNKQTPHKNNVRELNGANNQYSSYTMPNDSNKYYQPQNNLKHAGQFIIENNNFSLMKPNSSKRLKTGRLTTPENEKLNKAYDKYSDKYDKLKYVDFISRKKMQDELLFNINSQMDKLRFGLNDKNYEEMMAAEYLQKYKEEIY